MATNKKSKISDLIPDDKNFNKGTQIGQHLMEKSLGKFGAGRSILIDKNNRIIAGNKTIENAAAIGMEDVQIVESDGKTIIAVRRNDIDLDTPQGREMALADNATASANILFDLELIQTVLPDLPLTDWAIEKGKSYNVKDDNYTMPDQVHTAIKPGDLIKIGRHTLMCGDSTEPKNWKKLMEGTQADLVHTDPPYNVDYQGSDGAKIMNDKMEDSAFYVFLLKFYKACQDHCKPGCAWYVWHADSEGLNFRKAFIDSGLFLKQCLIWVKNSLVMGRQDYQWKHEPCLYGWKPGAGHYFTESRSKTTVIEDIVDYRKMSKPDLIKIVEEIMSETTPTTVLHHNKPTKNDLHPTMKPVLLVAELIENSSRPGETIADGFAGAGSTMVASEQLGRTARVMELDPKYCQVIMDRMAKLVPGIEIKINGKPAGAIK